MLKTVFAFLLMIVAATDLHAESCGAPVSLDDGWSTGKPEDAGFDGKKLCGLEGFLKEWPTANIHALVVARHGKLVFEQYLTGKDYRFEDEDLGIVTFSPTEKHDVRSISKSVTSLLIGIALGEGRYPALDSAVLDSLPEYAGLRTPGNSKITLRDLLMMAHGLQWNENLPWSSPFNDERMMFEAADPLRYVLGQSMAVTPGTMFNYSGGATSLLARVLERSTGKKIDDYAREKLFGPLAIGDFEWLDFANDKEAAAFAGLRLRPRDLAKIGQVVSGGGTWNGKRVVPASWIAESTKPRLNTEGGVLYYGYQWWLGRSLLNGRDVTWIGGFGNGGQRLYVLPELDLVVAINAANYTDPLQFTVPVSILNRFVLPAVRE